MISEVEEEDLFEAGEEMDTEEPLTESTPQPSPTRDPSPTPEGDATQQSPSLLGSLEKYDDILPLTERQLVKFLRRSTQTLYNELTDELEEHHWEAAASYALLKESIEEYADDIREQEAAHNHNNASVFTRLNDFTTLLQKMEKSIATIQDAVKDDPELTKKLLQASETYLLNSGHLTELLSLLRASKINEINSSITSIRDSVSTLPTSSAEMAKSSTSLAWTLGSRMSALESSQASLEAKYSIIQNDTSAIKSMVTEIFQAFKGHTAEPASAKAPTLALTLTPATVEGEKPAEASSSQKPPSFTGQPQQQQQSSSHTEGEIPIHAEPISSYQDPGVPGTSKGKGIC